MNEEITNSVRAVQAAKDPASFHWLTYLWVVALSAWGGIVRTLNEHRQKAEFNLREVFIDIIIGAVTSSFVGVLTFWLCQSAKMDMLYTAACIGLAGHMGAKGFELMRNFFPSGGNKS